MQREIRSLALCLSVVAMSGLVACGDDDPSTGRDAGPDGVAGFDEAGTSGVGNAGKGGHGGAGGEGGAGSGGAGGEGGAGSGGAGGEGGAGAGGAAGSGGAGGGAGSPSSAVALAFATQPQSGSIGAALASFSVRVVDASGDTVEESRAITLVIANNTSGATLGGTATQPSADGVAMFDNIVLDRPGTAYTLRASTEGLTDATSAAFDIGTPALAGTGRIFAVTEGNVLISFDAFTPDRLLSTALLAPLASGERVVGVDFRPADGALYAITQTASLGRLYVVDMATGALAAVGGEFALSGNDFGVDFNPVVDRVRVVSDTGVNLRLNPDTGDLVGPDTSLAYASGDEAEAATPHVVAAAYANNLPGAVETTLYGIDSTLGTLVRLGSAGGTPSSPNAGQLTTIGPLDLGDILSVAGFDLSGPGEGHAYAALNLAAGPDMATHLYAIDLGTGEADEIGAISSEEKIVGFTIDSQRVYGVSDGITLFSFNAQRPGTLLSAVKFTGQQLAETIVGIDFRPATGELYALGSTSRLYTVNRSSGALTVVGAPLSPPLSGAVFGFDFNPITDFIRVVSDAGQNLRLNPRTAAVSEDGALNPATPHVVGAGYDYNFPGTTTTTAFGIDSTTDRLVAIDPANDGIVSSVGTLDINVSDTLGFDIASDGLAYLAAVAVPATTPALYTVDLINGPAILWGTIAAPGAVTDLAVQTGTALEAYGISGVNDLVRFNPYGIAAFDSMVPVSGLAENESIVGIDIRPASGALFAVTDEGRLYSVNPTTGAATAVGTAPFATLTGDVFGVDFNPVVDRLRLVGDNGQNLRVNPETGALAGTDTSLVYAPGDVSSGTPELVALAYTENVAGHSRTSVYGVDQSTNSLVRLGDLYGNPGSPNGGQVNTIGPLDVNAGASTSFDLAPNGTALLSLGVTVRVVNLASGETRLSNSGGSVLPESIRALAIRQ